jgi:hypothetical protein
MIKGRIFRSKLSRFMTMMTASKGVFGLVAGGDEISIHDQRGCGDPSLKTSSLNTNSISAEAQANSALPSHHFSLASKSVQDNNPRAHHLYHNAAPQSDGLYHCPWEEEGQCQHRPDKLRCNYEYTSQFLDKLHP